VSPDVLPIRNPARSTPAAPRLRGPRTSWDRNEFGSPSRHGVSKHRRSGVRAPNRFPYRDRASSRGDDDVVARVDKFVPLLAIVLPGPEPDPKGFPDTVTTAVDPPVRKVRKVVLDAGVECLESCFIVASIERFDATQHDVDVLLRNTPSPCPQMAISWVACDDVSSWSLLRHRPLSIPLPGAVGKPMMLGA
jgi:hypothetical protein